MASNTPESAVAPAKTRRREAPGAVLGGVMGFPSVIPSSAKKQGHHTVNNRAVD